MSGHDKIHAEYNPKAGLKIFHDQNAIYGKTGYDMQQGQHPHASVAHCSDSRQKAALATGRVGLGDALEFANPGGFLTGPDGELTSDAGRWLDLTTAYGIDKAAIVQHSGCGQMNVIYTFHKVAGGADLIAKEKGGFFAADAALRTKLVKTVEEKGLAHYEAMGIPLVGDDASKFQQAMAIQQLLWDLQAVEEARKTRANMPLVEGQYQHIVLGRFFVLTDPKAEKFTEVCSEKTCCCSH